MSISKQNLSILHNYYLLMCAKYILKCQKTNISRSIDKLQEIFQEKKTILPQNAYQNDNDEEVIFQ